MKKPAPLDGQMQLPLEPLQSDPPRRGGAMRERRLAVAGTSIAYRLRRARRRTIGFQVDDSGLTVSAPRWVTVRDIEAAIVEKQRWIIGKLGEWRTWRARQPAPQLVFVDGGRLPVLGETVTLRLKPDAGVAALMNLPPSPPTLLLPLPRNATGAQIRDTLQSWLQTEATRVFAERLQRFAGRIDARFKGWTLSSARSQWGSCTHDGRIRLNWRLLHFPLPVIDYVIAHELAHLKELNHSARFWHAVGDLLPGFEDAREHIRRVDIATLPV